MREQIILFNLRTSRSTGYNCFCLWTRSVNIHLNFKINKCYHQLLWISKNKGMLMWSRKGYFLIFQPTDYKCRKNGVDVVNIQLFYIYYLKKYIHSILKKCFCVILIHSLVKIYILFTICEDWTVVWFCHK